MTSSTTSDSDQSRKVSRLIDEYELSDAGQELEDRWTADGDTRTGLRDLARWFNVQVLWQTMESVGVDTVEAEVETTYEILTGDDVSSGNRTQIRRRLERQGVDLESLESDFVSRQAIYTYLVQDRDLVYECSVRDSSKQTVETIRRLIARTETVIADKLQGLDDRNGLTLGDYVLTIDVQVLCTDCGNHYTVDSLLANDGCECAEQA